ncbi:uncharacterized protein LOC120996649 isoform X2 [Bufo bufo]|uniref:uncharacterized protein LOC120996649 isoform X2 n=1 Tax=Bufo bufo TaxID=8384 RepID=UPI001ABEC1C0|nr:uncharacterized protein LOC120996649 isoform X2 [Bufo bufo]
MAGFALTDDPFIGVKGFINTSKTKMWVSNFRKYFLVGHPEECTAIFESDVDAGAEQATFYLETYREIGGDGNGIPVAISCQIGSTNYLLCIECNLVILKEDELPAVILTDTSELIFYTKAFANGTSSLRFESSSVKDFCIAWNSKDSKVILKQYSENNLDETIKMSLTERD